VILVSGYNLRWVWTYGAGVDVRVAAAPVEAEAYFTVMLRRNVYPGSIMIVLIHVNCPLLIVRIRVDKTEH
jgi:hypothetical protein